MQCGSRSPGWGRETATARGAGGVHNAWSGLGRTRLEEEGVGPQIWGSLGPAESGLVKGMTFGVSIKNLPGESFGAN